MFSTFRFMRGFESKAYILALQKPITCLNDFLFVKNGVRGDDGCTVSFASFRRTGRGGPDAGAYVRHYPP